MWKYVQGILSHYFHGDMQILQKCTKRFICEDSTRVTNNSTTTDSILSGFQTFFQEKLNNSAQVKKNNQIKPLKKKKKIKRSRVKSKLKLKSFTYVNNKNVSDNWMF